MITVLHRPANVRWQGQKNVVVGPCWQRRTPGLYSVSNGARTPLRATPPALQTISSNPLFPALPNPLETYMCLDYKMWEQQKSEAELYLVEIVQTRMQHLIVLQCIVSHLQH